MIRPELQKKIDFAIMLIQQAEKTSNEYFNGQPVEISYSGGKDSDVILQLAKEANINFVAIYKNTTIDPIGTMQHCRSVGAQFITPEKGFFEIVKETGLPHRARRICCGILKEYKVKDVAIQGIRKSESVKRQKRYKEPQVCRTYSKTEKVKVFYPILNWTDRDVIEFITDRNIKLAPVYYDSCGEIDVKKRLGCLCCPLQSRKNRIKAFKDNPKILKGYIRSLRKFRETHPNSESCKNYSDEYEQIARDIFFESQKKYDKFISGYMYEGKPNCKILLENYFKIKI